MTQITPGVKMHTIIPDFKVYWLTQHFKMWQTLYVISRRSISNPMYWSQTNGQGFAPLYQLQPRTSQLDKVPQSECEICVMQKKSFQSQKMNILEVETGIASNPQTISRSNEPSRSCKEPVPRAKAKA